MSDWAPTPAAEIDSILAAIADPLLAVAGFRSSGRRRWVRSCPPVRHVFELTAMKGATLLPRWGISLDFVPHIKGGRTVAWHRTEKSAAPDLVYDPVDLDRDWERWEISISRGPAGVRREAERVLPDAVMRACAWLDRARDVPSVLERAEWLRTADRPSQRFGFENWVQQPIAYAFLLARTGSIEAGRQTLDRWIVRMEYEPLREELMALLER